MFRTWFARNAVMTNATSRCDRAAETASVYRRSTRSMCRSDAGALHEMQRRRFGTIIATDRCNRADRDLWRQFLIAKNRHVDLMALQQHTQEAPNLVGDQQHGPQLRCAPGK